MIPEPPPQSSDAQVDALLIISAAGAVSSILRAMGSGESMTDALATAVPLMEHAIAMGLDRLDEACNRYAQLVGLGPIFPPGEAALDSVLGRLEQAWTDGDGR